MLLQIVLAAVIFASPTLAQELELDFDSFDFDDDFEIIIEDTPAPTSLDLSAVVGLSYSGIGVLDESWTAQFNISNEHNFGSLGFLEWAGNVTLNDDDMSLNLTRIHLQNSAEIGRAHV